MRDEQGRERRVSRVDEDGAITLPLLGRVPVAGRTVAEVAGLLKERYAILAPDADVEVQLVEFRSAWVYVFGEVPRQGTYSITPRGLSILDALAAAGGPNPATAKAHSIFLLRPRQDAEESLTIYQLTISELLDGADVDLAAGDRLYVPPTTLAAWNRTTWTLFLLPIVLTIGLLLRY
jgi:polysaccharide export outer membrane protein